MSQILKHLQQRRGIDWFTSEGASHNRHLGRSRLAEYRIITWATPPRLAAKRGLMGTRLNEATSVLVLSIPIIVPRNVRMELNSPGDWIARRSSWSYSVLLPDRVFVQHPASSNCVFHGLDSKSLSDYLGFCEWQDTCLCLAVVSLTRLVYMSFVMTCWLRRVLCTILAWHAFSFLNLLPPHGAIAQDKPASDGPDKHRDTAVLQSTLPDPEFSPRGPFLGPLDIAHIARFNNLPRRMFLEPYLIPTESVRRLALGYVTFFDKTLREMNDDELLETAALSLARVAHEKLQDISGSSDILLKHLESHPNLRVRFACARALVNADISQSAAAVLKLNEHASDGQRLWIEPALARWKLTDAAGIWKQRLAADSETTVAVSLACDGLAALGDPQALDLLRAVLHGKLLAYEKRRAAAKAICALSPDMALAEAESLVDGSVLERLLGIELLSNGKPEAHAGLLRMCADTSDAVASAAWMALFRLNRDALISVVPIGRDHRDAVVRMTAARIVRLFPDAERSGWLHAQLSDKHLEVRNVAREMLFLVAEEQAALRDGIIVLASNTLTANSENWQGIEQSLLLLGQLRAAQFSDRCVPLLEHPRNEVLVTAAWLLHLFPDPAVEQAVRQHLLRNDEMLNNPATAPAGAYIGEQSSYLIQYAGLMRLKDLQAMMEPHFGKTVPGGAFKRAAAMWTLGLFHEGDMVPDLTKSFLERIADRASVPPELDDEVQRMSAVALGLMKAKPAVAGLLEAYEIDPPLTVIPDSARWALGMIGEPLPEPVKPRFLNVGGWKLSPADKGQ